MLKSLDHRVDAVFSLEASDYQVVTASLQLALSLAPYRALSKDGFHGARQAHRRRME